MHAAHTNHEIKNPGKLVDTNGIRNVFLLLAAVGVLTVAMAWSSDPKRLWPAFLHNHFFFLSLAVGGLFFAAIQWVTSAMWSAPIRRLAEAFTSFIPWLLVSTAVLFFGVKDLYLWTDAAKVHGDILLEGKVAYLNVPFFPDSSHGGHRPLVVLRQEDDRQFVEAGRGEGSGIHGSQSRIGTSVPDRVCPDIHVHVV